MIVQAAMKSTGGKLIQIPSKALPLVNKQAITSSGQLILPEALKLLPLYNLGISLALFINLKHKKYTTLGWFAPCAQALTKGVGLRTGGRIDDRSFWINHVSSLSTPLAIPLVYPKVIAVHDLDANDC
ncbi:unnamed protein product [Arabis nemorensis]|uniref:Uncharacterized protein n=1 Tax=Arabis nemorensis TaxID=586526 RepID=A0A565BWM0_9BRAS|nr:unnamed protein product [Arabis nemorensis]